MSWQNMKNICPNCFQGTLTVGKCNVCGYNALAVKEDPMSLKQFGILNNRYLLGCVIGAGGFGITYVAYDTATNQKCTIKEYMPRQLCIRSTEGNTIYPKDEDSNKEFRHGIKRFQEEADALFQCRNIQGIVDIYDYFMENGTAYYVMEYLGNKNLKRYMKECGGRIPYDQLTDLIGRAGMALHQAHEQVGIFHRDISPDNIMYTPDGRVVIIDFGSAKNMEENNYSIVLKPGFAPIEQFSSNKKQGAYTDVYALAATFYYLITGGKKLPVSTERVFGNTYTKLKDMNLGVSREVSDAFDRAVEVNPAQRTQTVLEYINSFYHGTEQNKQISSNIISGKMMNYENTDHYFDEKSQINQQEEYEKEILSSSRSVSQKKNTDFMSSKKGKVQKPYMKRNGLSWEIPTERMVGVGRSEKKSSIVIHGSNEISKLHFMIGFDEEKNCFAVVDKNSTNGTFVVGKNGNAYVLEGEKCYELPVGTWLCLGTNYLVSLELDYE